MSTTHAVRPPTRGVIWHFTDLHFHPTRPAIREDGKARPYGKASFEDDPFQELLKYVEDVPELKADFLVFSGDFVDARELPDAPDEEARRVARRAAFTHARKFMVQMARAHGLERDLHERVIVCPGNHDVDWAAAATQQGQSLTDYLSIFSGFLGPHSERPFTPPGTAGLCILPLDTTPFGGAPFRDITDEELQMDAGAYVPTQVRDVVGSLKRETGSRTACPDGVLGIVVSHHPPTVTPTRSIEVKPFEIAIGAGQVKYRLHPEGFRVFLTGHKHTAVAHQEHLYPFADEPAEGILILTGAPFMANGGAGCGFNVIEYAVSPESGEARVLVHPHDLEGFSPQRQAPRRFYLAPRRVPPASVLRLTQLIGISGDTRADYEFHGIPLPSGTRTAGWTESDQKWIRRFPREEGADQNTASPPLVAALQREAHATAEVPAELRDKANRRFHIQLEVPKSTRLDSVGYWERVFNFGAFAVSKGHQRRVCGDQKNVCPGVEPGWEGFYHLLREPVERLEFAIHLPFVLQGRYRVELETWTVDEAGERVRAPHLSRFSQHRIETNLKAKRIMVTVDHPLVGVGYSVKWELPENDPKLGEQGTTNQEYDQAIRWATRFQTRVLRFDLPEHAEIREAFRQVVEDHIQALRKAGIAGKDEAVEWTLFVPERKNDDGPVTTNADGRPMLTPAFASYHRDDPRWIPWPAGRAVVGRAFASNSQVEAIRPGSDRYTSPTPDEWIDPPMPVYEQAPGSIDHSVLYGVPVHVPDRDDIVWGVLTIGTAKDLSTFNLNNPLSRPAPGAPAVPAVHVLMKSLTDVFSRKLARFMKDGTAFAEPLDPEED
jgi:3',5'-cyclic AMP phosphodiesterase CpdA